MILIFKGMKNCNMCVNILVLKIVCIYIVYSIYICMLFSLSDMFLSIAGYFNKPWFVPSGDV